jgi:hypothetical protein
MINFDSLFVNRDNSILLQIEGTNSAYRSKVGGLPPAFVDEAAFIQNEDLIGYSYLFTLSDAFSSYIDGKELSVFILKNYSDYSHNSIWPKFNLICFVHPPYKQLSKNTDLVHPTVKEGSLTTLTKSTGPDEEYSYFIKIGSNPYLLQEEEYFYSELEKNGYEFIFQLDENGLSPEFLDGSYPFGFGSVYFYGEVDRKAKKITNIIAGYWQT